MSADISHAMVLAAGLGTRMRPLTLTRPKPLIEVAGQTLIDRTLDRLAEAGIARAVVNLHYKGEMMRQHLAQRTEPEIVFSDESDALLETGGGVARALKLLGGGTFVTVNSDMIWRDAGPSALHRLAAAWDDAAMDALLLLYPTAQVQGYAGKGDFNLMPDGRLQRRAEGETAPYIFTGVQILHARLFATAPAGAFSLNRLYDRAAQQGRLFGLCHHGKWLEVGTPDALVQAEAFLAAQVAGG